MHHLNPCKLFLALALPIALAGCAADDAEFLPGDPGAPNTELKVGAAGPAQPPADGVNPPVDSPDAGPPPPSFADGSLDADDPILPDTSLADALPDPNP